MPAHLGLSTLPRLGLPRLGLPRLGLPRLGLPRLALGAEPRWLLRSDPASSTTHQPIAAAADIDLTLATSNLERPDAHQLDSALDQGEAGQHQLLTLAGVFF